MWVGVLRYPGIGLRGQQRSGGIDLGLKWYCMRGLTCARTNILGHNTELQACMLSGLSVCPRAYEH